MKKENSISRRSFLKSSALAGALESVSVDNRGAFECFYNLYYDQVFRFAYYCLGEKEACREVVTDVFFSVWQSRKRLKDIDNIDTYVTSLFVFKQGIKT